MYTEKVKFLPWKGPHYEEGLSGVTTLVLGESHYTWNEKDINKWPEVTQKLVSEQIQDKKFKKAFWTNIVITFIGFTPTLEDKKKFWNSVAFYNYVQETAGDSARKAPPTDSWERSAPAFQEVLNKLNPDFVVILGYRLSSHLSRFKENPGPFLGTDSKIKTWWMATNGGQALATTIRHPSSGFNGRAWNKYILEALTLAAKE
ncbi:MAG: hypothetical protein RIF36_08070 [Imperialibacter sp.]|uniref:hypothetical protein n=1 Tax=Imperialibacter sp. TaxID=2038411 RepID=UPI0032EBDD4C